jgi:hypothetical protein
VIDRVNAFMDKNFPGDGFEPVAPAPRLLMAVQPACDQLDTPPNHRREIADQAEVNGNPFGNFWLYAR